MNEKMTKILNFFSETVQCRVLQFIVYCENVPPSGASALIWR